MIEERTIQSELVALDDIERMLAEAHDAEPPDPNRGVICSRGCPPGCAHVAHLVAAIVRDEVDER